LVELPYRRTENVAFEEEIGPQFVPMRLTSCLVSRMKDNSFIKFLYYSQLAHGKEEESKPVIPAETYDQQTEPDFVILTNPPETSALMECRIEHEIYALTDHVAATPTQRTNGLRLRQRIVMRSRCELSFLADWATSPELHFSLGAHRFQREFYLKSL